ncbi:hypothetical protein JTB14_031395 [Gonioctena quinquepunctata]|nr:hypothetical protein JTB14_031395 [Gonioctena quinquepunctata]
MENKLPFRFIGITRKELIYNYYLDLPSDEESVADENEVDEENVGAIVDQENNEAQIRDNSVASSPAPNQLAEIRIPSKWSERYAVASLSPKIGDCSLPDFVRMIDSPYELYSLFMTEDPFDDIDCQQIHQTSGRQ